jgi:DNA-binding GntR family transcriptional regulator
VTEDRATRDGKDVANVYERLRRSILQGEMRPGAITSQMELTRELGVGRTPLREALRMLQHEGLIVARPNRRIQAAPLSAQDAEELYVMRIALETVAIRLTVPQLDDLDIAELEGLMAQMARLAEAGAIQMDKPHRDFHDRLVSGSGERPAALIRELSDHAERYRLFYGATAPGHYERRHAEHRAILEAAAAGDADRAAEALALHYLRTAQLIFAAIDPDRPLARLRATVLSVAPGSVPAALD